jgi:hypothetical protein
MKVKCELESLCSFICECQLGAVESHCDLNFLTNAENVLKLSGNSGHFVEIGAYQIQVGFGRDQQSKGKNIFFDNSQILG